jgi:chromosome segregation ATPase|tara:strand:+ start:393 stop:1262 length:870 start_codon:yes stop_codon:yes gene_type:complete
LIRIPIIVIRVFALAGALFLFIDCAGRIKPWKFKDIYSLDVRVLDTKEWSAKVKRDMKDLDNIMRKELKYYIDKDLRIYERLEPNYEKMKISVSEIDSISNDVFSLYDKLKNTPRDSLDSVYRDTTVSYRKIIESQSRGIQKAQREYLKSLDKLKKGFKKDRKRLVFIEDEYMPLRETLYDIKYKRDALQPDIERFNQKLNKALFDNDRSQYSREIIRLSKRLESYRVKMDKFEDFLLNIGKVAHDESGGHVILTSSKIKPMKYIIRYNKGLEEYLEILSDIQKISESI